MNVVEQTLGLLSESDFVSLSAGVKLKDTILTDRANGARHYVTKNARRPLRLLGVGMTLSSWLEASNLTEFQAFEIIRFVNGIGCLQIQRSRLQGMRHLGRRAQLRLRGVQLQIPAKRYSATVLGVVNAVLRALRPILVAVLVSFGLAYGANMLTGSYIAGHLVLVGSLAVTTTLHEYVHLYIAQSQGANAQVVVRGLRIGVLHQPLSPVYEVLSALTGPLTGLVAAAVVMALTLAVNPSMFVVLSAGIVCVFHCVSWLPEYGDGVALKKYWRNRHERTT